MRGPETLTLTLEFARAAHAGRPFEFVFAPQSYLLRSAGGGFQEAMLPWGDSLLDDLLAVRLPDRDSDIVQRMGERLRDFLAPTEWPVMEAEIRDAVKHARPVVVTIRSGAAELYVLPWELLTLKATGQHIGELPGVLVRYEWPETETAPRPLLDAGRQRFLFAWSGHVPADPHRVAIQEACRTGFHRFDVEHDVLPHASCGRISERMKAATREGRPISILHLLCHGVPVGGTFGLALDGDEPGDGVVAVDPGRLRQILAPHARTLRLVVLAACDSGNVGVAGNQLGSIAQALHRAGIAAVVASRFPISTSGSTRLARALYQALVGGASTLEQAFLAAREHVAQDAKNLDWASLQLYARADNDNAPTTRAEAAPAPARPSLLGEELVQFRAMFSATRVQIALLGRYKEFHDALQDLETPFNAIVFNHKRLLASRDAWDELRAPLDHMLTVVEMTLQVLDSERLRDEFDASRRRLAEAGGLFTAAMAGDSPQLDGAIRRVRHVLGRDISTANDRLLTTARELRLGAMVAALQALLADLRVSGGHRGSNEELVRLIDRLGALHSGLETLLREHDRWQAIGNELHLFVESGEPGFEETRLSWPLVRASLDAVLLAGAGAEWTVAIAAAASELDGAILRGDAARDCIKRLHELARRGNRRFIDVDKQLLHTCGELRQVGETLDSVLKVIDES